ncbi:MAG: protein kinase [Acidobacteria bacterium]|nr:protein kinase [Acidobacteriota bacterium]
MEPDVEKLFHELADLTPHERAGYCSSHNVDSKTRLEVERLLAFDGGSPTLEAVVGEVASALLSPDQTRHDGRRCGPYRLRSEIGRGGMGTVYRADRVDGEITQQVAVKLLHVAADQHNWRERFLRERQFLASLNHLSIVRLLDAGQTEDGQPYLAMEYVDGLPIDRYAESKELRHQLEIFLRVCDAVAHAHRNLIIHRDLKPSNILVDSAGNPKLLDFGIAKLMEESSDPTRTVDRLLTPSYASPEQLTGARQTTASDVYSLGAILYRIFTGRSPHENAEGAIALDIVVGHREIEPPSRITPNLPLDLSYILMKALRREPEERYPSVTALSDDLLRYLNNQPVSARPASLLYRANRFVRRNRAAVTVVATVSLALVVTAAIAVREAMDAQTRFNQVRKMARTFLFDFHDELEKVPGTTKAKALVVSTAREYLDNLARSAGQDRTLLRELAEAYERLADVQGFSSAANMGQLLAAVESRRAAVAIRRRLVGNSLSEDAKFVNALQKVADNLRNLGRLSDALPAAREAVDQAAKLLKTTDPQIQMERSSAHQVVARILLDLGRPQDAESELRTAETLLPLNLTGSLLLRSMALREDHADVLQSLGRIPEAIAVLQQSEREGEKWGAEAPPGRPRTQALRHLQTTRAMLAEFYDNPLGPSLEQPDRGLLYRDKVCKGWEYLLSLDANNQDALMGLAICESETSLTMLKVNPGEAVRLARDGLRRFEKLESANPDAFLVYRSARAATRMALTLLAAGNAAEALRQLQPSLQKHRQLIDRSKDNPRYQISLAWTLMALARIEGSLGGHERARAAAEEAIRISEPLADSLDLMYLRVATGAYEVFAHILPTGDRCRPLHRAHELWVNWKGTSSPWVDRRREDAGRLAAACATQSASQH